MSEQLTIRPDDILSRTVFRVDDKIQYLKNPRLPDNQTRTVDTLIFGVAKEIVAAVVKIENRTFMDSDDLRYASDPSNSGGFGDAYTEMSIERQLREGKLTSTDYKVLLGLAFYEEEVYILEPEVSHFAGCDVFDFEDEATILLDRQSQQARFNRDPIDTAFVAELLKNYPLG